MQLSSVSKCFGAAFSLCTLLSDLQSVCFSLFNHNSWCERRWCSGSIVAFQAIDMGSIPVRCNCHPLAIVLVLRYLSALCSPIFNQFVSHSLFNHNSWCEHRWWSGSIVAFQAIDMGSIPVRCNCHPSVNALVLRSLSLHFALRSSISLFLIV